MQIPEIIKRKIRISQNDSMVKRKTVIKLFFFVYLFLVVLSNKYLQQEAHFPPSQFSGEVLRRCRMLGVEYLIPEGTSDFLDFAQERFDGYRGALSPGSDRDLLQRWGPHMVETKQMILEAAQKAEEKNQLCL